MVNKGKETKKNKVSLKDNGRGVRKRRHTRDENEPTTSRDESRKFLATFLKKRERDFSPISDLSDDDGHNEKKRKPSKSPVRPQPPPEHRAEIADSNQIDRDDSVSPLTIPSDFHFDENGPLVFEEEKQEQNQETQNSDSLDDMQLFMDQYQPDQEGGGGGEEEEPSPQEINIRELYTYKLSDEENWKGVVNKKRYQLNFSKKMGDLSTENHELYAMALMDMASRIEGTNAATKMGIAITPKNGETLYVHPRPIDQFSSNFLEAEMKNIMQSSRELKASGEELDVTMTFLEEISGSGRRLGVFPIFKKLAAKPNIFQQTGGSITAAAAAAAAAASQASSIPATASERRRGTFANKVQSYCLGTAIGRGIAHVQLKEDRTNVNLQRKVDRWKKLREDKPTVSADCWQDAKDLLTRAGITKTQNFTLDDVRKIQHILRGDYQLIVLNSDYDPQPIYAGEYVSRTRHIPLLYHDGHFELIFSLPQFVGSIFYCTLCFVRGPSEKLHYHCPLKCVKCLSDVCPRVGNDDITCNDCGIHFPLRECFARHKEQGPQQGASRCGKTRKCNKCKEPYYTDRGVKHECGVSFCKVCRCRTEKGHTHTLSVRPALKKYSEKRLFFDLETMEINENGLRKHRVVLACALRCCKYCRDAMPTSREEALLMECEHCSPDGCRYKEVDCFDDPGKDVMLEFVTWLLNAHHSGFVVMAHNLKGFDGQLLLQYALKPHVPKPKNIILCGKKINFMNICGMRVVDSFNFVPFALAKFSESFNVPEITKGEFPFRFIKEEHFDYNGPIPDKDYYGYSEKNKAAKEKFDTFYEDKVNQNYVFDFKRDIRDYCFSDVALLAAAMIKFEKEFLDKTNVMLFEEAVTAAGAAIATFQRNFVRPNTMALDSDPSSTRIKQSAIARRFIAYLQTLEGERIQCADNIGEFKIPGTQLHVDGYISPCEKYPRGKAIEFYGDYWHAHSCLYAPNQVVRGIDRAIDIRQRDAEREIVIRQYCDLEVFWECQVLAEAKTNKKLASMLDQNLAHGPVVCREGLFGGRTEVIRLLLDADSTRKLYYLDFTSLYPFVMKTCKYPIGQGRSILGSQIASPISRVEQLEAACKGYMSCKVIPPAQLFIPVLPFRSTKLLFTLCKTCGENGQNGACAHSDEERALYGTWTTFELELALRKGYTIEKVYGAVHWDEWTDDLFKNYINTFLREKQQASGWPSWVKSEADRRKYIFDYEDKEGILLDFEKIRKDEVTRQVSKLLLNSLWGKFGQRVDTPTTHIVTTVSALYRLMHNPTLEIVHVEIHNEHTITVQTRAIPGTLQPLNTSCIQYAILTTSHARCRLYEALEKIPEPEKNLAYMDTDSIIFSADRVSGNPLFNLTGEYLGELTSETSGEMMSFVSVGAKSYAYRETLADGKEKISVKAKGFSMNADAERKIDYNLMRKQVNEIIGNSPHLTETIVRYQAIKRTSNHTLINVEIAKKFKFTFDKRQIIAGGATIPFGFSRV